MVSATAPISLFVSFMLAPMLSAIWYDPLAHSGGRVAATVERAQVKANRLYRAVRDWAPLWPRTTLLAAFALLAASLGMLRFIGFELVPVETWGEADQSRSASSC
jgi:multidrug efflux pump subunit AcrB